MVPHFCVAKTSNAYSSKQRPILQSDDFHFSAKDGSGGTVFPGLDVHKELGMLLHLLQDDVFIDYQLDLNSALFIDPDIRLKICYKHALQDIYNVQVFKTNFS